MHQARSFVIFPAESGNNAQESDSEGIPDHINLGDSIFESAGKLEVDNDSSSENQENEEQKTVSRSKKDERGLPRWRKETNFFKDLTLTDLDGLAKLFLEFVTKLWKFYISDMFFGKNY